MGVSVREFQDNDKDALVRCIDGLQKYIAGIDPLKRQTTNFEDRKKYVDWLLDEIKAKQGIIYLAKDEAVVVGCIAGLMYERSVDDNLGTIPAVPGVVQELYVGEAYRGQGVGKALMEKLEWFFKEKGCDVLLVDVFTPNVDAITFYHKGGFVDRTITMLKKLR